MKTIRTYVNAAEAGFASSLLESAGIGTLLQGEHSFLLTPGFASGGIHLQVEEEDAEKALQLLDEGLDVSAGGSASGDVAKSEAPANREGEQTVAKSTDGGQIPAGLFIAGAAALAFFAFAIHQWNANQRSGRVAPQAEEKYEEDVDRDGRPDHFSYYKRGVLTRAESDRNGDGRIDEWFTYEKGVPGSSTLVDHSEVDQNFDGQPDVWCFYRRGELQNWKRDTDFDGRPDLFGVCEHGLTVRSDCRPGDSSIVIRRYLSTAEVVREEWVDEDRDGKFDYRILYDPFGTPSERIPVAAEK